MWVHEGLRVNPVESPHGATPGAVALGWESQGKGRKTSLGAVALRRSRSDLSSCCSAVFHLLPPHPFLGAKQVWPWAFYCLFIKLQTRLVH